MAAVISPQDKQAEIRQLENWIENGRGRLNGNPRLPEKAEKALIAQLEIWGARLLRLKTSGRKL